MRFDLSDEQSAFRDAAHQLLTKMSTPATIRAAWQAPAGKLDRDVWDQAAEMGMLAALIPESDGGLGLAEDVLVPVLQETGYFALPHPIVETAMVAAPFGLTGMVASNLGGWVVPCAADADLLLLHIDDELRCYHHDEVSLRPVETVDGARRAAEVLPIASGQLVTADPADIETARCRGSLGTASQLLGLSRRMLDLTVSYVCNREQFGVPIGSFQAVKHQLANALLSIEFAEPALLRAGHSLATKTQTAARDVSMAKVMAIDAAATSGRAALQCHGAIGYTVEYDLHLFLKRAWALSRCWGDRDRHVDVVAATLESTR